MLRLNLHRAARWITLPCGIELQVDPITSAIWAMASADDLVTDLPPEADKGLRFTQLTASVAKIIIRDWRGVVSGPDDAPCAVTPEAVTALMELLEVSHQFADMVVTPYLLLLDEKKPFAPLPTGISAGVLPIAMPATASAPNAPDDATSPAALKAGRSGTS